MHRFFLSLTCLGILSAQPQLRIELGFHNGSIKSLSTDSAERFLVTASYDKTIRLWDIETGRQLNVLRPPIGGVDQGKMFAAAITPDGAMIAAGGRTGPKTHSIYIFHRASGRMLHRIPGLAGVTLHLAYSPDGLYLAASLGDGGVRLYRASNYKLTGQDKSYPGRTQWSAFSPAFAKDRLLATAAADGYVRLYRVQSNGRLRLLLRRKAERKDPPVNLAFSPDAEELAVSFDFDSYPVVEIWNARTLALLHRIADSGIGGTASRIAWSADGEFLYCAGTLGYAGSAIVRWGKRGRGQAEARETGDQATESSIAAILPLREGSLLFASGRPALGMLDANWKQVRLMTAPVPGYLGLSLNKKFLLSDDGLSLRFGYEQQARQPAWFSVVERRLTAGETAPGLSGKPPDGDSIEVIGAGTTYVLLNRRRLKLRDGEVGIAVADVPGGRQFLLASQWRLVLFDAEGNPRWEVPVPAIPEAVNVSGDGRLAVTAYNDGVIRWYGVNDGKELLAFFPHTDRKRWVLWTPDGYYDCSPGGEDLFSFHTNRGDSAAADFQPAAKLRSTYYRPDIVSRALPSEPVE